MWRNVNPAIVTLWADVERSAKTAIESGMRVNLKHGISFYVKTGVLYIVLPSGRKLAYRSPGIGLNKFGNESITYMGMDQTTKQWKNQETYGGKLVENIVQAVARDLLADSMLRLDAAGFDIAMHVHDEVVLEVPNGIDAIDRICEIMGSPVPWAPGLPLRADAYETKYYKKKKGLRHGPTGTNIRR